MGKAADYTRQECFDLIKDCQIRLEELDFHIESADRFIAFSTRRISGYNDRIVELRTDQKYANSEVEVAAVIRLYREENERLRETVKDKENYIREMEMLERDMKSWELVSKIV